MPEMKAILFDLENTLIKKEYYQNFVDPAIWQLIAIKKECKINQAKKIFQKMRKTFPTMSATLRDGLGIEPAEFFKVLDNIDITGISSIPSPFGILKALKNRRLKVGLITNMPRGLCTKLLIAAKVEPLFFDCFITGSEITHFKPHVEPFLKALELLELEPHLCIMVGDREEVDLIPAKKLGIFTILIGQKRKKADFFINELKELIPLIDHIRQNRI